MFKITVQAESFEELKKELEPMFKLMDKFSKPSQPTAEDLGYSDEEDVPVMAAPAAPSIVETVKASSPVNVMPVLPPVFSAPPVVAADDDDGPVNTQAPDRDARNMPWDGRIHSGNRGLKKDGTWKYRRGVEQSVIDQIEKGLQAPVVAIPSLPPLQVVPALPPTVPVAQAPAVVATPVAPVVPAMPPQAAPVRMAHTSATFQQGFVMVINNLTAEGKVDRAWLQNIAAHYGVPNWWDIAKYNDKCQEVFNNFVEWGFITNVG